MNPKILKVKSTVGQYTAESNLATDDYEYDIDSEKELADDPVEECDEVEVIVTGNGYIVKTNTGEFVAESLDTLRAILKEVLLAKGLTRKVDDGLS